MGACQSCHWWHHPDGRRLTAMTTFLLFLALALLPYLYNLRKIVQHDHPHAVPRSHADWSGAGPPSQPYAAR
jgi:hypothetical protein